MKTKSKTKLKIKTPKSFVIDRKRWLRVKQDENTEASVLFSSDSKKMCCLGFYSRACGVSINTLRGKATPEDIYENVLHEPTKKNYEKKIAILLDDSSDSFFSNSLMSANDNYDTSDSEKEASIKKIFAEKKIKVTFK